MKDSITKSLSSSSKQWLKDRIILMVRTGSRAYGTYTDDSDEDFMGVCIPPEEYFYGIDKFSGYDNTGSKNIHSGEDVKVIHVSKFVKGLMDGVPKYLEILYVTEDNKEKETELGKRLVDNREIFVTKKLVEKIMGFARGKGYGLLKGRTDLIEKYGYDTKGFAHSVRLYRMAIEVLIGQGFRVYREDREELKEMIKGKYTYPEAERILYELKKRGEELYETTTIAESVDKDTVNDLLIGIVKESLVENKL